MTAAEADQPFVVTEPGVHLDIPHEVYLADPVVGGSLSHSGAKTIVNKTPALFAYERENGRPNKAAFDLGHAAHQIVLGVGPEIVAVDASTTRRRARPTPRSSPAQRWTTATTSRRRGTSTG
jgi:hypothetical protein